MMNLSRRQLMQWSGLLAPLVGATRPGIAQSAQPSYERDLPDMLLAHLATQLNALAVKWDAVRDSIRTGADVESRNRFVREAMGKMIHGLPAHHPPQGVVVRTQERNGYRVENLMFESRPDFWVTGNLYIPTTVRAPCPAIISPCGHYALARMQPDYQAVYQNLVHNGFVVLAYDPIGQGERRQYWDPRTGQADISDPVYEHSLPGQVLLLMGQDLTHYMVWDGMRAIDYLLTRPEVDASRIGCAGHSGGGTLTMFISTVDERVRCAVINEGGTRHRWPLRIQPGERFGPSDVEQNLFPAADYGIDSCDLHVAIAPRPLLALIENYSPAFQLAAAHIRRRYMQLGVAEKFATAEATDPHAYTYKLRLATTDWFCRWFYGRPGPTTEPDLHFEPPASLYCTPHGSLRYADRGQTIFTLIRKRGSELPPPRQVPTNAVERLAFRTEITGRIKSLLHFEHSREPLAVRRIVTTPRKGYAIEKLEFISEPGIYVPAWVFVPERKAPGRVILYANEDGMEEDGMEYGVLEQLACKGRSVIAIDVRGIGETAPPHYQDLGGNEFAHLFSVETAAAYMAWSMDRSLFGMRVQDLVRSVDYALSRPDVDSSGVDVIGKGAGALWALFAAALDTRIHALVAERGLISYAGLTGVDRYLHTAGVFIRDVLTCFDLPHVAAAIADRRVTLLSPVDPMQNVDLPAATATYRFTQETYARAGVEGAFAVLSSDDRMPAAERYIRLLQA
jgi:cephalosporin-C deacetylase-like acetyl esterase